MLRTIFYFDRRLSVALVAVVVAGGGGGDGGGGDSAAAVAITIDHRRWCWSIPNNSPPIVFSSISTTSFLFYKDKIYC